MTTFVCCVTFANVFWLTACVLDNYLPAAKAVKWALWVKGGVGLDSKP